MTVAWPVDLHLRVHLEDIHPGSSGGVENFASGIVQGLLSVLGRDHLSVVVSSASSDDWTERLPEGTSFQVIPAAIAGGPAWLKDLKPALRRSKTLQAARNVLRQWVASSHSEATIVDYFPYHRAPIYGRYSFVTVHDLRAFSAEFHDVTSQRVIRTNLDTCAGSFTSWPQPSRELAQFRGVGSISWEIPFPPMLSTWNMRRERQDFLLYPAATSPHKNHTLLTKAIANSDGMPPVICVGPPVEPYFTRLRRAAQDAGVSDRIEFRGNVPARELKRLYGACKAVVIPSKFEAASGPLMEAFAGGIPVVCSRIPALEQQVAQCGGEVAWFDPESAHDLERAVQELDGSYDNFVAGAMRGGEWLAALSWEKTAKSYVECIVETVRDLATR